MNILKNAKMAKVCLTLGGACFAILISSCAMSQQRSSEIVGGAGAVGGAALGAAVAKKHGKNKGDVIKGGLLGAAAGSAIGGEAGKRGSTLKDIGDVILDF